MSNSSFPSFSIEPVLALALAVALSAGCNRTPSGFVSGWARISGTVTRAADGAPVAGVTPAFAVFEDTTCSRPVRTTIGPVPPVPPVSDAAGRYQTDLRVFASGIFRGCLAVSAGGVTVQVPVSFAGDQKRAPAIKIDLVIP